MEIELDVYSETESPFLQETTAFRIKRGGFWTYEYERNYPTSLKDRLSEEHFFAILDNVCRIHSRFHILPVFGQAIAILMVLSVLELTLVVALYTPVVLGVGLLLTVGTPILYALIRLTDARDHQIATVSAFLADANVEFQKIGLHWSYSSPTRPLTLVAEEANGRQFEETFISTLGPDEELQDTSTEHEDRVWKNIRSKVRCQCLFIELNELQDAQALVSTSIPHSSHSKATCRISLFPSGRMRLTLMVAVMDVKSAWIQIQDLRTLALRKNSEFSLWEASHCFNADNLLDLLATHLED